MMIARSILSLTGHSPSEDGEETGVAQWRCPPREENRGWGTRAR